MPEGTTIAEILGAALALLVGGGAAWKMLPLLLGKLATAVSGVHAEKDMLVIAMARATEAEKERDTANEEKNRVIREMGGLQAALAAVTEKVNYQAETIVRMVQTIDRQNESIKAMEQEIRLLRGGGPYAKTAT